MNPDTSRAWTAEITVAPGPGPVAWAHFTDHYVMSPWQVEGETLIRALTAPGTGSVVTASRNAGGIDDADIRVQVTSADPLDDSALDSVIETLGQALGLADDVSDFYSTVVPSDPVLSAAAAHGLRGARLKTSPGVFEAIVAALASQNVHFSRTFRVMACLTESLGVPVEHPRGVAYTFPTPDALADASDDLLRSCGLGYRARLLRGLVTRVIDSGIDLDALRDEPNTDTVREALMELPGVGPFTADLVLSVGFRRPAFHLDSYTRTIFETLYKLPPDDDAMLQFVERRFGRWKHYAMLLLTTDTEQWATELGVEFPIRSAASYRLPDT